MGLLAKIIASFALLIGLGLTHIREGLNAYGAGQTTVGGAIKTAIIGAIDQGFITTANLISNFSAYVSQAKMGNLLFDGFKVVLLFAFIMCLVSIPFKFSNKTHAFLVFVISLIILIGGAFAVATYHNIPLFASSVPSVGVTI